MPLSHCGNFYLPTNLKATVYSDALLGSGCGCLNFTTQLPYNPKIGRWEATVDTCGGVTVRVAWDDQAGSYLLSYSCDGFQQAVAQQTCNPFFAAALFSAGGCCPPGKAADVYVSAPAAPLEVARICACPCDCASGGNPPPSSPPGFGVAPPYHKPGHPRELSVAPVRYATGELVLAAGDLAGGGFGMPWGHTRSFANRQADNFDAGQGYNWRVAQWPFLTVLGDGPLVATFDANNSIWFDAVGDGYAARHGENALLVYDAVADVFRLTDERGNATEYDGSTLAFSAHVDAAGNRTEVVSYLNDAALNPTEVQRSYTDSSGATTIESFVYGYQSSIDGIWRLASVLLRRSTDGGVTWTNIRQAVYTYWTDDDAYGALGDLKTATVQTWQDGAWADLTTTLYRYYKAPPFTPDCDCGSSSSSSSPVDPGYLAHLLKYVIEPDSYARLAADPNTGGDPANAPDWLAALYADNYFEYDEQRRVTLESVEGASRTYAYVYSASTFTPNGDYNTWMTKTVETLPGGTQNVTYANDIGQVMLSVKIPGAGQPGNGPWYEYFRYDANANCTLRAESSAVTGYDESYADLLNCQANPPLPPGEGWGEGGSSLSSSSSSGLCNCPPICSGNLQYLADHSGLIHLYDYDPASGQAIRERIRNGEFGCDNKLWERVYTPFNAGTSSSSSGSSGSSGSRETFGGPVYLLTQSIDYPDNITVDPNQSRQIITGYGYTFFPGTLQVQSRTTTWPVVSTEQNGSGVADSRVEVFDSYGNITWLLDERGFIHYQGHDMATGAVIQTITDFDTSLPNQPAPPTGWSTPAGGGLNLITDITVDALGRTVQTLGPWHEIDISGVATSIRRATWTIYQDADFQIWTGQGYATGNAGALLPLPPGEGWGEGGSSPSTSSSSSSISGADNFVLVNPVSITMFDEIGRVTDQIAAIRSTLSLPPGEGWGEGVLSAGPLSSTDSFPQSSYCRWTTNQYTDCCKLAGTRVYYAIPSSGTGAEGGNYNQTIFGYDFLNRQNRVVSPGGTIIRTVFDARDLPIAIWVGTNDTGATWADPTGGGATGNNMVLVTEHQYDNNLGGLNGNRTAEIQHVDASTARETNFAFDWRDRPLQVTAAQDWYQVTTLDNLGRPLQVDQHAQANGNLIRRSQTLFDDRSRVYQTIRYAVDPSTGTVGNNLVDNTWHDAAGNAIKQLPAGASAFTKTIIDGAGRQTTQYFGYTPGDGSSSSSSSSSPRLPPGEGWGKGGSPANVDGDIIVEQTETAFDAASNAIQTTFRQCYHDATGTGPLTYPGGTQPVARVTYVASYPDPVGREQASANYGTNSSVILSRPSTIPNRADTVLVTTTIVNPRGESYQTIDPAGRLDQTTFDDAGRRTELVLNVQTGSSSSASSSSSSSSSSGSLPTSDDQNNTTLWSYTADSQIATLTAVNSATGDQTTMYLYGTSLPGSDIARNDVLASVVYADGGVVSYLVNRQSQVKQLADQRGVVHAYGFDLLGRLVHDCVTSFLAGSSSSSSSSGDGGPPVDGSVQRIDRGYEARGMLASVINYDSPTVGAGNIVTRVEFAYNAFAQLVTENDYYAPAYMSAATNYAYADGTANTVRRTSMTYPGGRVLNYDYGPAGGTDDALSRVAGLIDNDGVTHLVDYTRLGAGTFVQQSSPTPQIAWSLINGGGADPYTGLDQFNRVVDNRWYSTASSSSTSSSSSSSSSSGGSSSPADIDRIQYGYDRASNRLWRKNAAAEAAGANLDELYAYDGLYRLTQLERGKLNSSHNGIVSGTQAFSEAWGLDATGNWSGWPLGGGFPYTYNQVNEITSGTVLGPVSYDAAGNTIQFPLADGESLRPKYDAWNRLANDGGYQLVYDGLGRLAMYAETYRYFYSDSWQLLETYNYSWPQTTYVWGLRYIDDLVCTGPTSGLYALQDANWNMSAVVGDTGAVKERYVYSGYGQPTYYNPDFTLTQNGGITRLTGMDVLFAGYRLFPFYYDLYLVRNRLLSSLIGRWLTRDPAASGANLYEYVLGMPTTAVDPEGLSIYVCHRPRISGPRAWDQYDNEPHNGQAEPPRYRRRRGGRRPLSSYNLSFQNAVLAGLQEVIGDCAKLAINYKYNTFGEIDDCAEITYDALGAKARCNCDACWQMLKGVLDANSPTVKIYRSDRTDNASADYWGFNRGVYINEGVNVSLPTYENEWNEAAQMWRTRVRHTPAPFSIVLWHEAIGHAGLGKTHPGVRRNKQDSPKGGYTDPTIRVENTARECLRKQGKKIPNRVPRYYRGDL